MEKIKVIKTVSDSSGAWEALQPSDYGVQAFKPTLDDLLQQYAHIDETRDALERYAAELSRLAEETARTNYEAQAKMDRKNDFFTAAAREIRASLDQVLETASTALKQDRPCGSPSLELICLESARSIALIDDLACLSNLDAPAPECQATEFDLTAVLENALEGAREAADRKRVKLELKADPKSPARVQGDSEKLTQVLKRLLLNSIENTSGGTVELEAEVLSSSTGDETKLRFFVNDDGPGYCEEQRIGLFQPSKEEDGDGLGLINLKLAICKQIAESIGGVLGVNSSEGTGSSYWLYLKLLSC